MSNKCWKQDGDKYNFYFTPYYDEELIGTIYKDADEDWLYDSTLLHSEREILDVEQYNLEDAKKQFEQKVVEHYEDEINYYSELLANIREA